ncbi:MAG: hypothetical protein B6227_03135 [Fusobacteriia bacterium 4572_74]|nr:MAG: hypothetical protein B6227_03135 [Fusobacteriia bacterium 4572_74]
MVLKKEVSKTAILSLAIGAIIGWGAFVLPGDLFLKVGMFNSIIAIFIGAIIMIGIEKNYGYLLHKFPVAGGEFAFTYDAFGWKHSLICGWFLTLAYISVVPLNATALALVAKFIMPGMLEVGYLYTIAGSSIYLGELSVAIFILCLFAYLNIKGIKLASQFQKIMVILLVGIVLLFLSLVIARVGITNVNTMSFIDGQDISLSKILKILSIAPMLFVGFDCIPQVAEELNFEPKEASKLAVISILIGAIIYIILILFTSFGITKEEILNGKISWATGSTTEYFFGKIGITLLVIALISAIVAGINGFYMAASRLLFAMSRGKILPEYFGVVDKKYHTPKNSILFVLVVSLIAPWFGRSVLLWIVGSLSVGASMAYLYTSLSSYKLYKEEYGKVFLPSIFGSIAGIVFLILLLVPGLDSSLSMASIIIVVVWGLIGIFFYKFYDLKVMHYTKKELDELILKRVEDKSQF